MAKKYYRGASGRFELIKEYEEALLAGENPKPQDYLKCYTGPKKELLIFGLNLSTVCLTGKRYSRMKSAYEILQKAEETRQLQATKEGLLRRILSKK